MAKRALLVGCNYPGTNAALNGCHNDVKSMYNLLTQRKGFAPGNIFVLTDALGAPPEKMPTGANIRMHLQELVAASKSNDTIFFHYSGHGTQVPAEGDGHEADGKDEAIVPSDLNLIVDDDLRAIFKALPKDAHLVVVADACHTGSILDGSQVQIDGDKGGKSGGGGGGGNIMQMFQALAGRGIEAKNKSLPVDLLAQMLSQRTGRSVNPKNIRQSLADIFGGDASKMALNFVSSFGEQYRAGQAQGQRSGKPVNLLEIIVKTLMSCISKAQAQAQSQPQPNMAPAPHPIGNGRKPAKDEQLPDEVGVLISGCQSHETSADACPSGDKSRAFGALTNAIITQVDRDPNISCFRLVSEVRKQLRDTGYAQNPCLECTYANSEKKFICD